MELERILCYRKQKFNAGDFCEGEIIKIPSERGFKKGNSIFEVSLTEIGEKYWRFIEYERDFDFINNIVL